MEPLTTKQNTEKLISEQYSVLGLTKVGSKLVCINLNLIITHREKDFRLKMHMLP